MITLSPFLVLLFIPCLFSQGYDPDWDSLDKRPLPQWYEDAKFGIFIHWGIFSVPSFGSEWFWSMWSSKDQSYVDFMNKNYPPKFTYQDFAGDFTAEFFDASQWADIFVNSGAKYVVLTSKHHEGYALWPSKYSYSWNSKDVGPGRDLVGELAEAVRARGLKFGIYHSLLEWYHPLYLSDKESNWTRTNFVDNKVLPELYELVDTYQPAILWSDGEWEAPSSYWRSTNFLAWLYNDSPVKDTVVSNDRWGLDTPCQHGDVYTACDTYDLQPHKWENAFTMDVRSWGYRREAPLSDYYPTFDLLYQLVQTVSNGGNFLLNLGPTKDGILDPIFQQRLQDIGKWMSINGEAVYGAQPWTSQNDSVSWGVWYTSKNETIYATFFSWPWWNNILNLGSMLDVFADSSTIVTLLGNEEVGPLKWTLYDDAVAIVFPDKAIAKSEWAYVLKITTGTNPYELGV